MRALAVQLAAYRRRIGLSQEQLGEACGLSARTISEIETGRTRWPQPGTLTALIDVLDLDEGEKAAFHAAARQGRTAAAVTDPRLAAVPRLPMPAADFAGRDRELASLAAVGGSGAVVLLHGMPGAGKTATAVRAGHLLAEQFPDGQIFVDLADAAVPAGVLTALGVGGIPDTDADQKALYRSAVKHRRLLLVVDNVTSERQVTGVLPRQAGCLTVLTSRRPLPNLAVTTRLQLGALPATAALRLLESIVGEARISAEPAAAAEVVDRCGRLPLALRIAGNWLTARPRWPVAYLAQRLRTEPLTTLTAGDLRLADAFESWSIEGTDGAELDVR